jgi:GT2 family glycosyltransferase
MCTYVIILNWNGWKDTIECLESVFRLDCPDFKVVVCDNASRDGSMEKIKAWARGEILAESTIPQLSGLDLSPLPKPISYYELTRAQVKSGTASSHERFVLIQNDANLGFAGGNNVGVRYALGDPNCQYVWLLNNDTIVEPHSLSALIAKASTDTRIGAVSSICYFADAPSTVEAWAGAYVNLWIGYARNSTEPQTDDWFHALYGASMLIARAALENVGLLDEGFFLYWDETEFCLRLRKKGWRLAAAPDSHILHKVNASTGGNKLVIDRHFTASGLRILRLHSKMPHLAMLLFLMIRFARRLARFQFSRCRSVWAGIQDYRQLLPVTPKIL